MTNEEKDKKEYELAVLVKNETDVAPIVALVGKHGAEGISEPRAKRLGLAYEIKKQNEAVFASFTFKAYGDGVKELESELNIRPDVLRFLIIASPPVMEHSTSTIPPHERQSSRPVRNSFTEAKPASRPLSNEALEKKIEEILQ
jgi:ribosomal protein S6